MSRNPTVNSDLLIEQLKAGMMGLCFNNAKKPVPEGIEPISLDKFYELTGIKR